MTGVSAAIEPFGVISAVSSATVSMMVTLSTVALLPPRSMTTFPTQAVTPLRSSASLTTNSEAMNAMVGSPKPAKASPSWSTPVAQSARGTRIATTATGSRSMMKQHHRRGEDEECDDGVCHGGSPGVGVTGVPVGRVHRCHAQTLRHHPQ